MTKLMESVPVDNNRSTSESADVKLSPLDVKVCKHCVTYWQIFT